MPRRAFSLLAAAVAAVLSTAVVPGCGPSKEELMAMERARVEREARAQAEAAARRRAVEERRKARDARAATLLAAEAAGDEAARKGDLDAALARYSEVLGKVLRYGDQDQRVRLSVIKVARSMAKPPPPSDEALRYMVRGEAKVKAGGAGSYEAAVREMERAVAEAPWFADGYFNLAMVQEKAGRFGHAIRNLRLYLAAAPDAPNARAVQAKSYELEVSEEEGAKTIFLIGTWKNRDNADDRWEIGIDHGRILIGSSKNSFEKRGLALEGYVDVDARMEHNCPIPGARDTATGTISEDGRSIEVRHVASTYSYSWNGNVCLGVTLTGKQEHVVRLDRVSGCRLCVDWQALTPEKAAASGLTSSSGVVLTEVMPAGPADKAGLRPGDVIVAFQGEEVRSDKGLTEAVRALPLGSEVWFSILHDGKPYDVTFRTGVTVGR